MLRYKPYRNTVWRMIEAQFRPATLKLVDTQTEQNELEKIIETSKPNVPEACKDLDYQFWSPFRYGCYPSHSRFRRRGRTPGVYYASENPLTAALETSWNRVKFYRASPDTKLPNNAVAHTAVQADIKAQKMIDLTWPDIAGLGPWMDRDNYEPCCTLADNIRKDDGQIIIYASVRDPDVGRNVAILSCEAFAQKAPIGTQTWHLNLKPDRIFWHNETLNQSFEYAIDEHGFYPPS